MHPDKSFEWSDQAELLAFIERVSFSTICVCGPALVHAPLLVAAPNRLLFHVSRGNAALPRLEGARAIASVLGPDAYVSPDWYGAPGQVPTWNYLAVEAEGPLRRLDEAELVALLDGLSRTHEARLSPKQAWTRADMSSGRFAGLLQGIVGFALDIEALRGTRKLGQDKRPEQRESVADALAAIGRAELAALTRPLPRAVVKP